MITVAQREEVINDLTGTCRTMVEILATFDLTEDDLTLSDHEAIDSEIFNCEDCGWWCGIEGMSESDDPEALGGTYCNECRPKDEEE